MRQGPLRAPTFGPARLPLRRPPSVEQLPSERPLRLQRLLRAPLQRPLPWHPPLLLRRRRQLLQHLLLPHLLVPHPLLSRLLLPQSHPPYLLLPPLRRLPHLRPRPPHLRPRPPPLLPLRRRPLPLLR